MISNPKNSQIRAVRKLRKRRERERRGAMLVEGHRAVGVAIRAGCPILEVVHTRDGASKRPDLIRSARASGAKMLEVSPEVMASVTGLGSAPDVIAVVPLRRATLDEGAAAFGLGAVLAGVHDPGTAGSILASCAAAGGSVAIATTGTTDLFAPKPVRSAAGAHFLLRVVSGVDPVECAEVLKAAGIRLVAVAGEGRAMDRSSWDGPLAVVVGEEDSPVSTEADERVRVAGPGNPIRAPLAAEAAVVLFEAENRRRGGDG